jgi:CubicO group peptidase (beta-lactamase class C family)
MAFAASWLMKSSTSQPFPAGAAASLPGGVQSQTRAVRNRTVVRSLALLSIPLLVSTANPVEARPRHGGGAAAAPVTRRLEFLSGYIGEVLRSTKAPGLSVAVARHGRIIWERGYGWAVPEQHVRATSHTIFGLASISKSITGTELMLLADRGRLRLDAPINTYLGAAKLTSPRWNVNDATVRRVATHTAGLTSFDSICYADEPDCDRSLKDAIERHGIIFWKPGTRFDYSNLGFGTLSYAIGKVTGTSFEGAVQRDVFRPLGMRECALDRTAAVAPHYADGIRAPGQKVLAQGASGLACSADSLVRLGMFMLKDRSAANDRLGRAIPDQLVAHPVSADDPVLRYSMGWWINPRQYGYRIIYASCGTVDSGALLYIFPAADVAIAVLGNGGNPHLSDIADKITAVMLPRYRENLAKAAAAASQPAAAPPAAPDRRLAGLAGTWTGAIETWVGSRPVRFVIRPDGSTMASINGAPLVKERDARIYRDGFVLGAHGNVDTPETNRRRPYRIGFEVYPDGAGDLEGAATTWQDLGARNGGVFSYPVRLHRTAK